MLPWTLLEVVKKMGQEAICRQERQQLILEAMADKLTSASSITHFNTLMNQIQKNVKTDLKLGDLNTIRTKYKRC